MKNYKIFAVFLLLIFIFTSISPVYASDQIHEVNVVPPPPELTLEVSGAILMEPDSGEVLYSYNADELLYPASTTKIMTAYLCMKYGNPADWISIPQGIYSGIPSAASTANLKAGEEMYVYEILQCLMIVSANEAANAIAIYISGTVEDFITLMNEEAAALGCTNTHFVNTNGLHNEDHYTTPRDMSIIARAAMEYDTLVKICASREVTIRETNLSEERNLKTTNYLLTDTDYPSYGFNGAYGLKTGFTTPAGYCLVACAYRDEKKLLSVVFGADSREISGEKEIGSFTETARLLSWGFENFDEAVMYQDYLEQLPEPEPSPSPTPTPTPSPSPYPSPSPSPSPSCLPSPSPSLSPSLSPSPAPTSEPSPLPSADTSESENDSATEDKALSILNSAAITLGISAEALLLSVLGAAIVLLILVVLIFVRILKSSSKNQ